LTTGDPPGVTNVDPRTAAAYWAAVRALTERGRFGIRLGLGRTRALLRELGHPERAFRGALVAGTNGKGSVLALASSALRAAGLRTGETPKPHLVSYRERLQVDGRPVDPGTFSRLVSEVLPIAERVERHHGPATEFELLTALIFRWFAEQRLDVAIVEVGLGGRLDATHAWDGGVAVVTNVSLDHMDRLGDTVPKIAREKAAIIERGDLAVTGATGEALDVIRGRARRVGVPLREVGPAPLLGWDRDGLEVESEMLARAWRLPLRKLVLNDVGCVVPKPALERIGQYVGKEPPFESFEELAEAIRSVSPFGDLTDEQWRHLAVHAAKQDDAGHWRFRYDPAIGEAFSGPLGDVDLRQYWNSVRGPVLVIRGAESDLLTAPILEEMKRRPHTESLVVPNCGHPPMLMDDAQVMAVRRFLLS